MFQKNFLKKFILENFSRRQQKHEKLPCMQEFKTHHNKDNNSLLILGFRRFGHYHRNLRTRVRSPGQENWGCCEQETALDKRG